MPGVALLGLLVLVVGAERRLADAHLNRQSAAPAYENGELLDGDEIRVRLLLLAGDSRPDVAVGRRAPSGPPPAPPSAAPPPSPARAYSSRAPPPSRAAR